MILRWWETSSVEVVSDDPPSQFSPPSIPGASAEPPPPPPTGLVPPPGYTAYDEAPRPELVRRIGGLATTVTILTTVVAVGTVATTLMSAGAARDADEFLEGQLTDSEFQTAIGPLNAIQLLTGLATLTTAVISIIWMYRIAKNLRAFGRTTTWSPLFAIFGWLLPPMVLYIIPFLMLRELWKASGSDVSDSSDTWKKSRENAVLWVWFAMFGLIPTVILLVQVGSLASGALPSGDLDSIAESLQDFGGVAMATGIVSVAAAVVWILFVRQLSGRHTRLTGES